MEPLAWFKPFVKTEQPFEITTRSARLQGILIDDGGHMVTEYGFVISDKIYGLDNQLDAIRIVPDRLSDGFPQLWKISRPNHKYFYCAFATNAVGTSYGSVESFKTLSILSGPDRIDAQPGADPNWWTSEWFGSFMPRIIGDGSCMEGIGWVFAYGQPDRAVWLWHTSWLRGPIPRRSHFSSAPSQADGYSSTAVHATSFYYTIILPTAG